MSQGENPGVAGIVLAESPAVPLADEADPEHVSQGVAGAVRRPEAIPPEAK